MEGVSEYMAIQSGEMLPRDTATIKYLGDFLKLTKEEYLNEKYAKGYWIVKTILDSLGIKKGINAILKNPTLLTEEIYDIKAYSKIILCDNQTQHSEYNQF